MKKHVGTWALALFLALVSGCTMPFLQGKKDEDKSTAEKEPEVIIPVEASQPTREDISAHFETTTRVKAENRVDVVAEGMGECLRVSVEEGDLVSKGQVLAELDKEEAVAALRQLEIQVAQNKTSYEIAERSLAEGLGAKVERDNARFAHEQAAANLATQRLQVKNLTIRAPIDAVVTERKVQAGQMVSTATPVFTLVDPASYICEINPPEKELARLREGQVARVSVDALEGEEFEARVRRVNPAVDPLTGTLKVVLDFDEDTRAKLREAAFARVRLVMETHTDALILPKDSLVEEDGRKYVFVVTRQEDEETEEAEDADDEGDAADTTEDVGEDPPEKPDAESVTASNTTGEDASKADQAAEEDDESADPDAETDDEERFVANRVVVEVGFEDSNRVEILSGIDDESMVVTLGQHTLKPGARVKVTNAEDEISARMALSTEEALAVAKAERAKGDEGGEERRHRGRRRH